jgi:short-subunit dehydrogenase
MKQTVLITGASSGIGEELARLFARDGFDLILVARSGDKLTKLASELEEKHRIRVKTIAKDLGERNAPREVHEEVKKEGLTVDILVNNAGFGLYGEFIHTDLEQELNMIDLNVRALTELTKLFLPGMVERKQGGILNVSSAAAFQPGPLLAVYYATKAYVLHFSEALANELEGTGVTVTALCPGPTATNFSQRAGLVASKLFDSGVMDVKTVAKAGYRGFILGKPVVIPGFRNRLLTFSVRLIPRRLVTKIVRMMQERK